MSLQGYLFLQGEFIMSEEISLIINNSNDSKLQTNNKQL